MPFRTLTVDGETWTVMPSGRTSQYARDEFGLVFMRGHGAAAERRAVRYSPQRQKNCEASLGSQTDAELLSLLQRAQPAATAPELGYGR